MWSQSVPIPSQPFAWTFASHRPCARALTMALRFSQSSGSLSLLSLLFQFIRLRISRHLLAMVRWYRVPPAGFEPATTRGSEEERKNSRPVRSTTDSYEGMDRRFEHHRIT